MILGWKSWVEKDDSIQNEFQKVAEIYLNNFFIHDLLIANIRLLNNAFTLYFNDTCVEELGGERRFNTK